MARLDQLMEHFRSTRTQSALVVDEFGGTEGIVSVEDVVESLVGDIVATDEHVIDPPRMIGFDKWLVDGDTSVHDWAEAFGHRLVSTRVATLGGLIIERLGRAAEAGDVVDLGNVRLEVATVDRARVESAIVTLIDNRPRESEKQA
jgi:putative hemolysin